MLKETLKEFFVRDLTKVKIELSSYPNSKRIWGISKEIKNSAGNLTLHIIGNLKHFIGAVLGNSGYIRDRDSEFNLKNISLEDLLKWLDETIDIVNKTLTSFPEETFSKNYPLLHADKTVTTDFFLIHLLAHLNYHLGQINYHRRLID